MQNLLLVTDKKKKGKKKETFILMALHLGSYLQEMDITL